MTAPARPAAELPTLAMLAGCYAAWAVATTGVLATWPAVALLSVVLCLHSSLQHETIHGHPFRRQWLSDLTVFPALGLVIPYERFRALHLKHHHDPDLTDPIEDPESAYLVPAVWERQRPWVKRLLTANNTLAGRLLLGPAIGNWLFLRDEIRAARAGDRAIPRAWALHLVQVAPVVAWIAWVSPLPVWAYLLACYLGQSLLKIRVFLEHRAHARPRGRTAVVEDRGPLAWLFLFNNFHAVHHAHPGVPWYALPGLYEARRANYLRRNHGYRYAGYGEVFRRHLFRTKEPVAHPLMPGGSPLPEVLTAPVVPAPGTGPREPA